METTTKMQTARSGKKLVTDEIVLSMLIDIHQKSSSNYLDYDDLREKYKGTVASILSVLRKREIIIKCGKSIVWQGDYPDMKMATSIKNEYRESARISSKKSQENRAKVAQYKKNQESIRVAEEVILDPLNFEVPLNAFKDLGTANVNPALMPIEDFLRLQIDSYIRQTANLQSEIEELKNLNDELKSEIESHKYRIKLQNQEFKAVSSKNKDAEDEIYHLTTGKISEKRPIKIFGIKIGSIG